MLAPIGLVLDVELLRDGGSLVATFQCLDSSGYGLLFKVDLFRNADGNLERRGFLPPVLIDGVPGLQTAISWSQAELLLNQIKLLIENEQHRQKLLVMIEVAQSAGQLPPTINKIVSRADHTNTHRTS